MDAGFDIFDEIVTSNLFGVDLNPESVEITRLSLWLKTARRDHRLQNLEATIRCGHSLIGDQAWCERPFDWKSAFAGVFGEGGFDIVIGNPPYVRMEHLKSIKPYLEEHFVVAGDRADLYAYFFERGVGLLKDGGRLGYISSSTFFRTGSGENLRAFLADKTAIESVVDFGDLQIFEGVTTYPAVLTLRKNREEGGDLSFLHVKDRVPDDLVRTFTEGERAMPRTRLGRGSWRFESDELARVRDKIATGRPTLGEIYGAPLCGIKTGLNQAFVIDRATRDRLVAADAKSAKLLEPFLRGENIERWRVESEDLFLINTPKGDVDITAYPAVKNWLLPFKQDLERRATRQNWWELQQAQLAYQPAMRQPKLIYPEFSQGPKFTFDTNNYLVSNKCFFLNTGVELLAMLNSKAIWFWLFGEASPLRGGQWRLELREQYVSRSPLPTTSRELETALSDWGHICTNAARRRLLIQADVRHRILDLAGPEHRKLNRALENWHELHFSEFRVGVKKALRSDIPVRQRSDWERYLSDAADRVRGFTEEIELAERKIDDIVYQGFGLTPDEVSLLEASLVGQY